MARFIFLSLTLLAARPPALSAADKFEFKGGDKVVLIGSTLIEREQRYGYWEAALTARNPDKNITFRNLGWSGDNVWGEARAGFGTVADGYKHLIDHVKAEKPTVIIVGYGTNESFAGPAGLPKFKEQLKKLLDDLSVTKARFVLLSPMKMQKIPPPLPDPAKANANLSSYAFEIRQEAVRREAEFIDLFIRGACQTENGQHPTALGYWGTADWLFNAPFPGEGLLDIVTVRVKNTPSKPVRLKLTGARLPVVYEGRSIPENSLRIEITDLAPGNYSLQIDQKNVLTATAAEWAEGKIRADPDLDQADQLRQAIIAKNELYFHRWRPQNVTYLFGFRKYEQGNNAIEIPKFDPLIEAKEKEIAKLRVPREHVYELVPAKEEKK